MLSHPNIVRALLRIVFRRSHHVFASNWSLQKLEMRRLSLFSSPNPPTFEDGNRDEHLNSIFLEMKTSKKQYKGIFTAIDMVVFVLSNKIYDN
jgi:hypothetical protein